MLKAWTFVASERMTPPSPQTGSACSSTDCGPEASPRSVPRSICGRRDTAPTPELRHDWHAAPDSEWGVYADRYRAQLAGESGPALRELADALRQHPIVTLVYAAHDPEHNHAVVLEEALRALL